MTTERPEIAIARILNSDVQELELMSNLYCGQMRPPSDDIPHCVAFVQETGGPPPEVYLGACPQTLDSTVQVLLRSDVDAYAAGKGLAVDIWTALQTSELFDPAGDPKSPQYATMSPEVAYKSIRCAQSGPIPLARDGQGHYMWSINVDTLRSF